MLSNTPAGGQRLSFAHPEFAEDDLVDHHTGFLEDLVHGLGHLARFWSLFLQDFSARPDVELNARLGAPLRDGGSAAWTQLR